jgi:hypothetical protein
VSDENRSIPISIPCHAHVGALFADALHELGEVLLPRFRRSSLEAPIWDAVKPLNVAADTFQDVGGNCGCCTPATIRDYSDSSASNRIRVYLLCQLTDVAWAKVFDCSEMTASAPRHLLLFRGQVVFLDSAFIFGGEGCAIPLPELDSIELGGVVACGNHDTC